MKSEFMVMAHCLTRTRCAATVPRPMLPFFSEQPTATHLLKDPYVRYDLPKPSKTTANIHRGHLDTAPRYLDCEFVSCCCAAPLSVSRIHPESVFCSLAFTTLENSFNSASVKRTGTIRPLASPLGSLGRPIFLVLFLLLTIVPHDCCLNGLLWRCNRRDM